MHSPSSHADQLFELETALHRREVRNSRKAVSDLLADEFVEFGSSGRVFNKAQIIEALQGEPTVDPQIVVRDFAARELAPNVVLVTYIAQRSAAEDSNPASALRSSIWKLMDGRWQIVFHQGTRAGREEGR